ncbi:MAG: glycosyltransferase family 4 protein [Candidatus Parvarchaeota archaeon]
MRLLQGEKSGLFDFTFALNGLPIDGSGGTKIVIKLVNALHNRGIKVAVLVFPRSEWMKVLDADFQGFSSISKLIQDLNDFPNLYRLTNPILTRIRKGITGGSFINGVKIYNISYNHIPSSEFYVATNFINATELESLGIEKKKIILFSQIDETQELYSHNYAQKAESVYSDLTNKVFINRNVAERFPPAKVIPMAIDLDNFHLVNRIDQRNINSVIFSLRKGIQKDPDTAIGAINDLHRKMPDVQISAYGNLDPKDVPSFVNYFKSPTDRKLSELLNSNAIFCLTSRLEGYPLPPLEAMACGCAVVSTDNIGIREYLINGENGVLVPPGKPLVVSESIISLMTDKNRLRSIEENGLRTALDHTYGRMIEKFLEATKCFKDALKVA